MLGIGSGPFLDPRDPNRFDLLINCETFSLFQEIAKNYGNLRMAILFEDFANASTLNSTDYEEIYNYDNFLLICECSPCQCYVGNPQISSDGFVSIIARYDDYYLYPSSQRTGYMRVDYTLAQGLYAYEWDFVINQSRFNRDVKLILVNSWNEYHERSEIEPHYDYSDPNAQPFLLTNSTRQYLSELESAPGFPQIQVQEYELILTAAITVSALLLAIYSVRKFVRTRG